MNKKDLTEKIETVLFYFYPNDEELVKERLDLCTDEILHIFRMTYKSLVPEEDKDYKNDFPEFIDGFNEAVGEMKLNIDDLFEDKVEDKV